MKKDNLIEIDAPDDGDINVFTLYDSEKDKNIDFEEVAAIEYEGKTYTLLTPAEPEEDFEEGEIIIMQYSEDEEGNLELLPVEDDDLLEKIFEEFQNALGDQDDCEHDCDCGCDSCKE